jgi:flavin reductase (DIM6/NTAB) family NADH-FMN oxidoreductase RutF
MGDTKIKFSEVRPGDMGNVGHTLESLGGCGCLLVAGDDKENNVMTIGWGSVGILWGKPVFSVLVRKSRHTHQFLEEYGEFTVNVPRIGLDDAVALCGSKSGRDMDKFKEAGLTRLPSKKVKVPGIEECGVIFECKTIWKTEVDERVMAIPTFAKAKFYPKGDLHTIYFGEIVAARAGEDIERTRRIGK